MGASPEAVAMSDREAITRLFRDAPDPGPAATEALFELVYPVLRRMAGRYLSGERIDHTLQPTELVHEAFLRLVEPDQATLRNRAQFLAAAGRAMRQILVDHARRRGSVKRGGGWRKLPLEQALDVGQPGADEALAALGDALRRFEAEEPLKTRVVEMLYFGGLTHAECAEALGVSPRTVARYWDYAQAWLYTDMRDGDIPDGDPPDGAGNATP
jgi:RNA polymerase sigma factor (TIGR02999 family)